MIIQLSKVDKNKKKKKETKHSTVEKSVWPLQKAKNCQNLPDVPSRLTTNRTDAASLLKVSMC